ncbi:hypothetical protein HKD37_01G001553 [Glycine soja]
MTKLCSFIVSKAKYLSPASDHHSVVQASANLGNMVSSQGRGCYSSCWSPWPRQELAPDPKEYTVPFSIALLCCAQENETMPGCGAGNRINYHYTEICLLDFPCVILQILRIMASPPASPPAPPPPASSDVSTSSSSVKRTRKASRLRSLSTRAPEASDSRTKRKLLQTIGERWRRFKLDLTRKWALAADQDGVDDTVCDKYDISKEKWAQFCQTRRDPSWEDVHKKAQAMQKQNTAPHVLSRGVYEYLEQKLLAKKTKKKLEEAAQSGSVDGIIDPPSPIRCHVKWKMVRTKKTWEMTTEAAKEIDEKIDSFKEKATQGSFVPHGCHDVLTAAIGRPKHLGRVRVAGAGVTIKLYFGSAP